jgi:hypothetical protein
VFVLENKVDRQVVNIESKIDQLNNQFFEKAFGADALEEFVSLLKKYTVYDLNGEVNLVRLGKENDGGYVVSEVSLRKAEALLGYGVNTDISFEEEFSEKYGKNSYGFDCTIDNIDIKNKLTHFVPECIKKDGSLKVKGSELKESSFNQQLKNLNLENKKLFIKMDIEGDEYKTLYDILDKAPNITGIAMELHFDDYIDQFKEAEKLLKALSKDFYLINVHANNCAWQKFTAKNVRGNILKVLQLSYVNKNLVDNAKISDDQKHPSNLDTPNNKRQKEIEFEILN